MLRWASWQRRDRAIELRFKMKILRQHEIAQVSRSKRLELIGQLWDSLKHEQFPLTDAQQEELVRRLASLDQDRCEGISWAALKTELEQRCP